MTIIMQEGAEQETRESGTLDDEETTKSVKQAVSSLLRRFDYLFTDFRTTSPVRMPNLTLQFVSSTHISRPDELFPLRMVDHPVNEIRQRL